MCKKKASDCQPTGDNAPVEEGNLASEDEDEPMDSDDEYYSETSSDEGASESDADSATGNRITPDMIVWLMLKENGIITQEKYNEKAELCEEDIKSLIPKLPKAESSELSDDESRKGEKLLIAFLGNMARIKAHGNNGNAGGGTKEMTINAAENSVNNVSKANGNEGSRSETTPTETTKAVVETAVSEEKKDVTEDKAANIEVVTTDKEETQENVKKSNEKVNNNVQEVQRSMESNEKECIEKEKRPETETSSQHVINETVNEESVLKEYTVPKCLKCCKISSLTETKADNNSQDENNIMTSENNKNLLNKIDKEAVETNENQQQQNIKIDATSTNTEESQNMDVKSDSKSNQASNKKTRSFKFILKHLEKEKRISNVYAEYVDVLETYVKDLDEQYRNNKAKDKFDNPSRELKEFAFFLNFYSPSCYKYIVETFNTPLPEHKVLCSWYMKDDEQPGLSGRAFRILKQKAAKKRLTCALMSRDIFMKNYSLDYDQVDYGGGCNYVYTDKAVITFVFVLVSLDEAWKIPIGYIFAKRIPPETQAEFIRVCLTQCHEAGVDVVAVTLDSLTPAEFLGCSFQDVNNLKTVFKHPICDSEVAVWIDPCLAIRSARLTLKVKGVLHDDAGNKVRWNLIRVLRGLYSAETVDFERPKLLQLRNHIAKVGLTTEIFSDSLAPALQLCEELFPHYTGDTAPTRRYIEVVNALYDILNSKVTTNLADVEQQLNAAKDYMISLFCNRKNALSRFDKENLTVERLQFRSFVEGKPACGFIAFLICIESFKHLCTTLVEKEQKIVSLNPHRLCKDHVENFVKNLRAFDRLNPEDFNGVAFQSYYDYLFDVLEQNPNFSDKNVKVEYWMMKNKHSPLDIIKLTSGKRAFDEVYSFQYSRSRKLPKTTHSDLATKLVREYSKAMDTEMDLSTRKNMVGYLAGWIAAKFAKCLKCEVCIDSMCTDKKQWFHKFITSTHLKGVCLPSEELFRICWECERALRMKTSPARLRAWLLRQLAHAFPWARGGPHHPLHRVQLARAVLARYVPLRVPAPLNARDTQRVTQMFSVFTCIQRNFLLSELLQMRTFASDDEVD
ncbi:uncharacterized protein LOC133530458 [Cydia pomonella]|uniref:uncharacterized protein LOC133530458 n=1 Tax=Cydia pomonella TaxID=82600 RepID=UPI002ADDA9DC|nr:uncharacterized protein LOC133530458 [Cydia pomonella]